MHTNVVHSYEVFWYPDDELPADLSLELEDDIVSDAVFVYQMNASFGDLYEDVFVISRDYNKNRPNDMSVSTYLIETSLAHRLDHSNHSLQILGTVRFTVRAVQMRSLPVV